MNHVIVRRKRQPDPDAVAALAEVTVTCVSDPADEEETP